MQRDMGEVRQPGFDLRRRGDGNYRKAFLDGLYAAAAEAQVELTDLAIRLAGEGARQVGVAGWRKKPKDGRRAEDKVTKYRGDVSKVVDLAAAKVEFRGLDHLYAALEQLSREPGVRVLVCDDRFKSPQASGYRDIQLKLRMANGHVAEFRLHLSQLDEVAEWEHALYEVRRDLDSLARHGGRELSTTEKAIQDGLLRREQQLFWQALSTSLRG